MGIMVGRENGEREKGEGKEEIPKPIKLYNEKLIIMIIFFKKSSSIFRRSRNCSKCKLSSV